MIKIIADNIISPLGETTEENLKAVREGVSALCEHHLAGMPESFVGSLIEPHLGFEEGLIRSIAASLAQTEVDAASEEVIFIISSTKGNVAEFECIGASAEKVARHFGNPNRPIVVSNACISGLSAQILAMRLLRAGHYKTAVVAGMDVQGKFIVSGFQSFKALSPEPCRPFDGDRCGLNLGEAAASMILTNDERLAVSDERWAIESGCVRNDGVHISNPSRTGEGCLRAIQQVLPEEADLACISAHGTATLYNDEMEACAIDRAGLAEVPTFSLKGYYGHTMGASGILETIITLHAVKEGWIPATRGYEEAGTSHEIHITAQEEQPVGKRVMKLLSGFGGCNGAMTYVKLGNDNHNDNHNHNENCSVVSEAKLTPADAPEGLTALYKQMVGDYPKFYKMDPLCKLGFLATEALLRDVNLNPEGDAKRSLSNPNVNLNPNDNQSTKEQKNTTTKERNDTTSLLLSLSSTYAMPWTGSIELKTVYKDNNQVGPGLAFQAQRVDRPSHIVGGHHLLNTARLAVQYAHLGGIAIGHMAHGIGYLCPQGIRLGQVLAVKLLPLQSFPIHRGALRQFRAHDTLAVAARQVFPAFFISRANTAPYNPAPTIK